VLAHSDVAPGRKQDPGEKFPWRRLSDSGVGLWVPPPAITKDGGLSIGASGEAVQELQENLSAFGYGIDVTGAYDSDTADVATAFQRHFRPTQVDGQADASTCKTLVALLDKQRALDNAGVKIDDAPSLVGPEG
jgi:N-acetylmuramoyl-L-alanine amidase